VSIARLAEHDEEDEKAGDEPLKNGDEPGKAAEDEKEE
jgi:hypothetical protein